MNALASHMTSNNLLVATGYQHCTGFLGKKAASLRVTISKDEYANFNNY